LRPREDGGFNESDKQPANLKHTLSRFQQQKLRQLTFNHAGYQSDSHTPVAQTVKTSLTSY